MPQTESVPVSYQLDQASIASDQPVVRLNSSSHSNQKHTFTFELLRPGLYRTTFTSPTHPLPPHPSAPKPSAQYGSSPPRVSTQDTSTSITHASIAATVDWSANSTPVVTIGYENAAPLQTDLPHRSYTTDGPGIAHYTRYARGTLHVGLGEKAAPMDLSNRTFTLSATDCFGYDVYRTDPMYKHIPLLINLTPAGCVATFSTSHSRGMYSVGGEMDGLFGWFKVYRQDYGGLEEYTIVGKTVGEVVHKYAELVGFPLRLPRWAFGYISGGYRYASLDEPRAADALMGFADKLREHDIPCSAMQLSSGYCVSEEEPKVRNVFTWNKHRFPDPKAFVDGYMGRGIRLMANIKPYLLKSHPEYDKLVKEGALFEDPDTGKSAVAPLWSNGGAESGLGGHIDFTSKAGFDWWYNGVKELRELGVDCMWNDNNEYTIPNDGWKCALETVPEEKKAAVDQRADVGLWGRAMHTELMGKSSHDALLAVKPDERPFVLTRSATAGTMRYAGSTWSGDNVTSWDGMKGSNAISLTGGMCLLQCYGHDIGGFEGPQPSPELLVRWIQLGTHTSRFAINCFKTSPENMRVGEVIEPWMYPETTPIIRAAIKRRYEMLPYIYSLHLESHMTAKSPQRWTGWGYESDPEVWCQELKGGETQFWFGDALLVGGVFEPGKSTARMYLPKKEGEEGAEFLNLNAPYQYFEAGQWVDVESQWQAHIPVLAKVGTALPVGKDVQTLAVGDKSNPANLPADDYRAVEIFPTQGDSKGKWFTTTWFEDDGVSNAGSIASFTLSYSTTEKQIAVKFESDIKDDFSPAWKKLNIVLPMRDQRDVLVEGNGKVETCRRDRTGRNVFTLSF